MEYSTEKEILQPIFDHGMEGMSEVLQKLFNLAMKLERDITESPRSLFSIQKFTF